MHENEINTIMETSDVTDVFFIRQKSDISHGYDLFVNQKRSVILGWQKQLSNKVHLPLKVKINMPWMCEDV